MSSMDHISVAVLVQCNWLAFARLHTEFTQFYQTQLALLKYTERNQIDV